MEKLPEVTVEEPGIEAFLLCDTKKLELLQYTSKQCVYRMFHISRLQIRVLGWAQDCSVYDHSSSSAVFRSDYPPKPAHDSEMFGLCLLKILSPNHEYYNVIIPSLFPKGFALDFRAWLWGFAHSATRALARSSTDKRRGALATRGLPL